VTRERSDTTTSSSPTASQKRCLGKDVFLALAAVAWADGRRDPDEADAIVRAALEEGLSVDEISEIEAATREGIDIGVVDRSGMSKADRLFVYAVACWIAYIDGVVEVGERDALAGLGERLGVPERLRAHAESVARDVLASSGPEPLRYDLAGLRQKFEEEFGEGRAPDASREG